MGPLRVTTFRYPVCCARYARSGSLQIRLRPLPTLTTRELAMSKSACVLFSALLIALPASGAEIFKCVAKDGTDLYQNFPCGIDSIGSVATKAPTEKAGVAQSDSKQAKPNASLPAGVAAGKSIIAQSEPRIGMTTEEVRAMWGEPTDTRWEEPGEGDLSEVWSYGDSRSVRFVKDRVSAIQK